ncbi:MAG: type II and III secretion system protein [Myxococcales bacterium]|nr:type II and III secretion system protein [Myxococcales bacterium]
MRTPIILSAFAFVLGSLFAPALAAAQQPRELALNVGDQTSISARGVRSYSEGVRGIAEVRLTDDETQFVVVGLRQGTTSLMLIMQDGTQVQYRIVVGGGEDTELPDGAVIERENIRLDFYFVQLSDSYIHSIGIGWPGSIGGGSQANFNMDSSRAVDPMGLVVEESSTTFAIAAQSVLPRLDLAQASGWARIFRQAAVVTANNTEAQFQNGGEINVPIQGALTAEIQRIEFGTSIKVRPRFDPESGRIEVHIMAEVSDLSDDRGSGIPGRVTSELQTVVNLELGQSIVLAGLIGRSERRSRTGLPGLSQIPILGALFGVHQRQYEENEALLFIVPSVVDPIPLSARNRIQEAIRLYDEFNGGVDEIEVLEQPRFGGATTASPTPPAPAAR